MEKIWNEQRVLVLGLGASGLAMARWFVLHGAYVTVVDNRPQPPHQQALLELGSTVKLLCAEFEASLLQQDAFHAVFKSPGLSPQQVRGVWTQAIERGLVIGTELSVFIHALKHLQQHGNQKNTAYVPSIIAITGTNGKTTVTSLTGLLLQRTGKKVAIAGNIGPTLLDTLRLNLNDLPDIWVLELSSFQLDGVRDFDPDIACILNLTQDHLDWHGSMQAYGEAKACIFGPKTVAVIPRQDAYVQSFIPNLATELSKPSSRKVIRVGLDEPQSPQDWGCQTQNGLNWLVRATTDEPINKRREQGAVSLRMQHLMPVEALRIRGKHNTFNALTALAMAYACYPHLAPMLHALREYPGEPHRLQSVAVIEGVEYFDDSKGTNVGATVAALESLGWERKLVVILGGEGKGQDFSPLAQSISAYAKAVVLIGKDAALIRQALSCTAVRCVDAHDLSHAVIQCHTLASSGDVVLLSPACASQDMFRDYVHRGQEFVRHVHALSMREVDL